MARITITVDGQAVRAEEGQNVLEAAQAAGIDIPSLCHHPDVAASGPCGLCLVAVKGREGLVRACETAAEEGLEVVSESPEIAAARRTNMDAVLDSHVLECPDCVLFQRCRLLQMVQRLGGKPKTARGGEPVTASDVIEFDAAKCIGCGHCAAVCPTGYLEMGPDGKVRIADGDKDCINCGQCIVHCPVGAIEGDGEFEELAGLESLLKEGGKTVVIQFAPAVRASIGEEFGLPPGEVTTGRLVAGLKEAGFRYVFDTAVGADFTTMEESDELIERVSSGRNLPAMSSCCPAWVKFLELEYPEMLPSLCTSRSPQVMLGGILKSDWAVREGLNPDDVFVVSVMPCVAKKFEVSREEMRIDGRLPVDMVLTVREAARFMKRHKVDLKSIGEAAADNPYGEPSGAGVIYGASGGVFESALRTAYFKMMGEEMPDGAVREIRGTAPGVKRQEIKIGDRTVRVAVVSGLSAVREVLREIKEDPKAYDAVEVMACPGGCVGGGGQPMPMDREAVRRRAESLYAIDAGLPTRRAHENPSVKEAYAGFFADADVRKKVLHTGYGPRRKSPVRRLKP